MALPVEIAAADFAGDEYLRPVVDDDALILALDSLPESQASSTGADADQGSTLQQKNEELQSELKSLTRQFENYRLAVQKTLDQRWGVDEETAKDGPSTAPAKKSDSDEATSGSTDYYFESYSHSGGFIFYSEAVRRRVDGGRWPC